MFVGCPELGTIRSAKSENLFLLLSYEHFAPSGAELLIYEHFARAERNLSYCVCRKRGYLSRRAVILTDNLSFRIFLARRTFGMG